MQLLYNIVGAIVVNVTLYILFCWAVFFMLRLIGVFWAYCYVFIHKELGVKENFKKMFLWKVRLFFQFVLKFHILSKTLNLELSDSTFNIDCRGFWPKITIY